MQVIGIYQKEMSRIEASEHLGLMTVYALGGGNLKRADSTKLINQLQRAAAGGAVRKRPRPSPQQLAAMGIKVEIVKSKEGEEQ